MTCDMCDSEMEFLDDDGLFETWICPECHDLNYAVSDV